VADVVRAAASVGLRVAPQGTGHGAPPLAGRFGDAGAPAHLDPDGVMAIGRVLFT
jgi:hypothetical protein